MDILNCYFSYILICQFLYIVSSRLHKPTWLINGGKRVGYLVGKTPSNPSFILIFLYED
jgi:hypothetical protein